ncbi:hypothetical protein BU16DRAFT_554158 [Lophium mytilinum]|uniref:Uncharacterized protein n=1 Tax=Lophium mytilinum TaxID=390894 RepID=A0A6A6RBZ7_9PEZI|nr:hypothetical protein BU16DRAFT_554158 [Lophium mytilinum]
MPPSFAQSPNEPHAQALGPTSGTPPISSYATLASARRCLFDCLTSLSAAFPLHSPPESSRPSPRRRSRQLLNSTRIPFGNQSPSITSATDATDPCTACLHHSTYDPHISSQGNSDVAASAALPSDDNPRDVSAERNQSMQLAAPVFELEAFVKVSNLTGERMVEYNRLSQPASATLYGDSCVRKPPVAPLQPRSVGIVRVYLRAFMLLLFAVLVCSVYVVAKTPGRLWILSGSLPDLLHRDPAGSTNVPLLNLVVDNKLVEKPTVQVSNRPRYPG